MPMPIKPIIKFFANLQSVYLILFIFVHECYFSQGLFPPLIISKMEFETRSSTFSTNFIFSGCVSFFFHFLFCFNVFFLFILFFPWSFSSAHYFKNGI